ncbi:hypothetical protein AB1N83_002662 [Pleurotus pulmonarius]
MMLSHSYTVQRSSDPSELGEAHRGQNFAQRTRTDRVPETFAFLAVSAKHQSFLQALRRVNTLPRGSSCTIGDAISGGVTLSGSVEGGMSRAAGGIVRGANSDVKEVGGGVGNVVDDAVPEISRADGLHPGN